MGLSIAKKKYCAAIIRVPQRNYHHYASVKLNKITSVQECDARGDAMKYFSRVQKLFLSNGLTFSQNIICF